MHPATQKKALCVTAALLYLIIAAFVIRYLAGVMYFLANKTMPHGITLHTSSTYWHYYAGDLTQRKRLQFAMGFAVIAIFGLPLIVIQAIFNKERSLHGDARFARCSEVRKDRLFGHKGILIGKMAGSYVMLPGQTMALVAAPTRQGKGAGIVIPNLLNFPDSVVVLDIKLENFQLTSLFRQKHGQKVFLFNPFAEDGKTHRWNPMDAIRRDPNLRVVDVVAIGEMLYPRTSDDSGMWNDLARDLFMGLTLYLMETSELPCTFGEVLRQASGKGRPIKEHIQSIMADRARGEDALSDPCFQAFGRFCGAADRTLSSIVNTMTAPLTLFVNPYVDAATSATDFDVRRVRKDRMTIYVGIPANRMASASVIVNLFFSHLINENMAELPEQNAELRHQCLIILDEFTTLGRVGIIAKSIGQMAGYNLRLLVVIQGISQLISVYGEHDARTIEDGCAVQLLYPPRAQKDANEYSEMLGAYTAKATSTGVSRPRAWGTNSGSASENISDHRRVLMLPQELREMAWTSEIIVKAGIKPILCDKALYFTDPVFMNRLKKLSPTLAAMKGLPSENELKLVALTQGELSIALPNINMEAYKARVERRIRGLTVGEELDPCTLVIDTTSLPAIDREGSFVACASFVDALFERFEEPTTTQAPNDLPRRTPDGTTEAGRIYLAEVDVQPPLTIEQKAAIAASIFGPDESAAAASKAEAIGTASPTSVLIRRPTSHGEPRGRFGVIDLGALLNEDTANA